MEHKIHVEAGPEYAGETYIWCECKAPEGTKSMGHSWAMSAKDREAMFDEGEYLWHNAMIGDYELSNPDALGKLIAWLREHGAFPKPEPPYGAKVISERCGVLGGEPRSPSPSA